MFISLINHIQSIALSMNLDPQGYLHVFNIANKKFINFTTIINEEL